MPEVFDLSDNPITPEKDKIAIEAKNIYNSMYLAILEPLKDAFKEYNRGEPNQLIQPDILNQILVTEDDFIKLYISEFRYL